MADSKYQVSYQRPSQHVFYAFYVGHLTDKFNIPFNCPFAIKEMKISCGYTAYSKNLVNVYGTMTTLFPGSSVLFTLSNNCMSDAVPDYIYSDGLDSTVMNYCFREPIIINGTHTLSFATVGNLNPGELADPTLLSVSGMLHFELLG